MKREWPRHATEADSFASTSSSGTVLGSSYLDGEWDYEWLPLDALKPERIEA